jgi:hypothetical protein
MGKTLIGSILGMLPMEIFILLELNNRLYLCSKLFFFVVLIFKKCEIYSEYIYLVYEMAGDIDKWTVSRTTD